MKHNDNNIDNNITSIIIFYRKDEEAEIGLLFIPLDGEAFKWILPVTSSKHMQITKHNKKKKIGILKQYFSGCHWSPKQSPASRHYPLCNMCNNTCENTR